MYRNTTFTQAMCGALLTVAIAAPRGAVAQRTIQPSLVAGASSSTLQGTGDPIDRRTGFTIGAGLQVPLGTALSFQTGLTYVQKGASSTDPELGTAAIDLAYLQVPAMLRFAFGSGSVRPYVDGGLAFAYRLTCSARLSADGVDVSAKCGDMGVDNGTGGSVDPIKKMDASALIGAGLDFGRFSVGARYDHGLTNIDNTGADHVTNRSVMILAGYRIGG